MESGSGLASLQGEWRECIITRNTKDFRRCKDPFLPGEFEAALMAANA